MSEINYGLETADVEYVKSIKKCNFYGNTDILPEGNPFGPNALGDIWMLNPLNRLIIFYREKWHILPEMKAEKKEEEEPTTGDERREVIDGLFRILDIWKDIPEEYYQTISNAIDFLEIDDEQIESLRSVNTHLAKMLKEAEREHDTENQREGDLSDDHGGRDDLGSGAGS